MNSKGVAKTPHYAGPISVMTVREVSACRALSRLIETLRGSFRRSTRRFSPDRKIGLGLEEGAAMSKSAKARDTRAPTWRFPIDSARDRLRLGPAPPACRSANRSDFSCSCIASAVTMISVQGARRGSASFSGRRR